MEKLKAYRDTPLGEILAPDEGGMFVLLPDCFASEVGEVVKSVAIFKLYEVLDLNESRLGRSCKKHRDYY
eukprot:g4617.t1